jgi:hypothetical protein
MGQRGTWNNPGGPPMPPHHLVVRARPGRTWAWCGAPCPSTYSSTCHSTLSPEKTPHHFSDSCSCCSCSRFWISLLSPSLLLRFGAFVLWNGREWTPTHPTWIGRAWSHESPPRRGCFPFYLSMLRIHEGCRDQDFQTLISNAGLEHFVDGGPYQYVKLTMSVV